MSFRFELPNFLKKSENVQYPIDKQLNYRSFKGIIVDYYCVKAAKEEWWRGQKFIDQDLLMCHQNDFRRPLISQMMTFLARKERSQRRV